MADDSGESTGKGVVLESEAPRDQARDIALVNRARRERWPIPEDRKSSLVDRLFEIAQKKTVAVAGPEGILLQDESTADKNAIAAAKVLVAMDCENAKQDPAPVEHEHRHTHELGPITVENFEQHRRQLLERADRLGGHS